MDIKIGEKFTLGKEFPFAKYVDAVYELKETSKHLHLFRAEIISGPDKGKFVIFDHSDMSYAVPVASALAPARRTRKAHLEEIDVYDTVGTGIYPPVSPTRLDTQRMPEPIADDFYIPKFKL